MVKSTFWTASGRGKIILEGLTMRILIILSLVVLVLGCSGSSPSTSTAPSRNERLIIAEEIATTNARNAQEVIERLRPMWLNRMPGTLYMNDVYTSLSLRDIEAGEIRSIEFLTATDATTRFGTNHARGAIVIKTK